MLLNTNVFQSIMDRTPTEEDLDRSRRSLDEVVSEISTSIDFKTLDVEAMKKILICMGENYPLQVLHDRGVYFYDVGYVFLKRQIAGELGNDNKNSLLVNGIMGWLFYNPGTSHQKQMDDALLEYVGAFGVQELNEGFARIRNRFEVLQSVASQMEVLGVVRPLERNYVTVFIQSK